MKIKQIIKDLEDVRSKAVNLSNGFKGNETNADMEAFKQEPKNVSLYIDTWVIGALDLALEELKK